MTQNYQCMDDMWGVATASLRSWSCKSESSHVSRDGDVDGELLGYSGRLIDVDANFLWCTGRKLSMGYACAELLWYLSGLESGEMIKAYATHYERFLVDGVAHGAYGARWRAHGDQIQWACDLLAAQRTTRQAVLAIWEAKDLHAALTRSSPDVPCTLGIQYVARGGRLHCIATMRSNDAWLGMPYDVWCFSSLQKLIAHAVGLKPGWYQHQAGSLHLYTRDAEKAERCGGDLKRGTPLTFLHWPQTPAELERRVQVAVREEIRNRRAILAEGATYGDENHPIHSELPEGSFLRHCVEWCARKLSEDKTKRLDREMDQPHHGHGVEA